MLIAAGGNRAGHVHILDRIGGIIENLLDSGLIVTGCQQGQPEDHGKHEDENQVAAAKESGKRDR